MKLYEVPPKTKVRVLKAEAPPPGALFVPEGEVVFFDHIDGMYSYCLDSNNNVVHLKAWTEVEIINERN